MNKKVVSKKGSTSSFINHPSSFLKVVFVDFDGTLADTMDALWVCFQQFLKGYGAKGTKADFKKLTGPSISEITLFLKAKYHLKSSSKSLEKEYQALVAEAYKNLKFFPHAVKTLKGFKELGLKIAIVTASPKLMVKNILVANELDKNIDEIITPNLTMPAKPDPAIYLKALRKFSIQPSEAVAIEDSLNGCSSSTKAGIFTILLTHNQKTGSHRLKEKHGALIPLHSWRDVQQFIFRQYIDRS